MQTQSAEKKSEFTVVKRKSGVALVMFDSGGRFNSLGSGTMAELEGILKLVEADDAIKAVVGISGKPDNFIIGADLYEIRKASCEAELLKMSSRGQELLNQISLLAKPFVVAINGACLGGGLELAMAAHSRIASTNLNTRFGLPETRLGLIPGCGGTQRLPRLVGLKEALEVILGAETMSAEKALSIGLIDELVHENELIEAAEKKALALAGSALFEEIRKRNRAELEETPLETAQSVKASNFCLKDLSPEKAEKLLNISERAVKLRTKGRYPAQLDAIKAIRSGLKEGLRAGLATEAQYFAQLGRSDVSANLIALFFSTDLAKSLSLAMVKKFSGKELATLGIVGAGTMGQSISRLAAARGIKVILQTSEKRLSEVSEQIRQTVDSDRAENLVELVSSAEQLKKSEIVLECVMEDPAVKNETIAKLGRVLDAECIIASNTSSLSISELSKSADKPANFLGIHFFHPVERMPLVEIIAQASTSKSSLARACELALKLDKVPLIVKDTPGFLINRLLTVYLFELARLAEEGTPLNWVEESMLEFGMPVGPLQLMDEIGLDVAFAVAKRLEEGLGERMKSPEIFKRSCAIGMPGKRGNVGFYLWENSEKKLEINPDMLAKTGAVISSEKCNEAERTRITDRMILTMLDEAARCVEEKVIAKAREVDFALVLGVGFPAFRGGLFKYADHRGLKEIIAELEKIYAFTESAGSSSHRSVSTLVKKYADEGRGFYSLGTGKDAD